QSIDTVVLDKTGTVTKGEPTLTDVVAAAGFSETDVLQLVGTAESQSEHPLAQAIVQGVKEKNIQLLEADSFEALTGYGIADEINQQEIFVGKRKLMREENITIENEKEIKMEEMEKYGKINNKKFS